MLAATREEEVATVRVKGEVKMAMEEAETVKEEAEKVEEEAKMVKEEENYCNGP